MYACFTIVFAFLVLLYTKYGCSMTNRVARSASQYIRHLFDMFASQDQVSARLQTASSLSKFLPYQIAETRTCSDFRRL